MLLCVSGLALMLFNSLRGTWSAFLGCRVRVLCAGGCGNFALSADLRVSPSRLVVGIYQRWYISLVLKASSSRALLCGLPEVRRALKHTEVPRSRLFAHARTLHAHTAGFWLTRNCCCQCAMLRSSI